jgi:hypothetical protein
MTYQQHEELFLQFDQRIQNKQYKNQTEREFLIQHSFIHEMMAANLLPEQVLHNAGLRMRNKQIPPALN